MLRTIKEWELFSGIKLMNLDGFRREKNKVRNRKYSEKQFRRYAKECMFKTVCNKGIDFMRR